MTFSKKKLKIVIAFLLLPISVTCLWLMINAGLRFYTFDIRYDSGPNKLGLGSALKYEFNILKNKISNLIINHNFKTSYKSINLFIPENELSQLNSNLPHSGYKYVKGRIIKDEKLQKIKVKYRGDYAKHWHKYKKSLRVKTSKDKLFENVRRFNLLATRQIYNHLTYKLARSLDLHSPKSYLVNVNINMKYQGIFLLVEQIDEGTLRNNKLMPGDIFSGEMMAKDEFTGIKTKTLFERPEVWKKVSFNNHYKSSNNQSLSNLIKAINEPDLNKQDSMISNIIDIDKWARLSVLESLIQSTHFDIKHNWRIYYDPWIQKFIPIVWDGVGFISNFNKGGITRDLIHTKLHKALFNNSEFLIAREQIFREFFSTDGAARNFYKDAKKDVFEYSQAIQNDPYHEIDSETERKRLNRVLKNLEKSEKFFSTKEITNSNNVSFNITDQNITLNLKDVRQVSAIKFSLSEPLDHIPNISVSQKSSISEDLIEKINPRIQMSKKEIIVSLNLLPNSFIDNYSKRKRLLKLNRLSTEYLFNFGKTNLTNIKKIEVYDTENWITVKNSVTRDHQSKEIKNINLQNWKIFVSSLNTKNFRPVRFKDYKILKNGRIIFSFDLPLNSKAIRIDPPPRSYLKFKAFNISFPKIKKIYTPTINRINMMTKDKEWIISSGKKDPFIVYGLNKETKRNLIKKNNRVSISFDLKISEKENFLIKKHFISSNRSLALDTKTLKGDIYVTGTKVYKEPVEILAGTKFILDDNANIIFKNKVTAIGNKTNPIVFEPQNKQTFWGMVALIGPRTKGSIFNFCHFTNGSGLKTAIANFTAMLSLHQVENFKIDNCFFANNFRTDDMVHTVYSSGTISNSKFLKAKSDAVDIDISSVNFYNNTFEANGNDAIDLMDSNSEIYGNIFELSGDKGISVGEGSIAIISENLFKKNIVGVQAKDKSLALISNSTFSNNNKHLDAYKKNWRYGDGGEVIVTKSLFSSNIKKKKLISSDKNSQIFIFDSYINFNVKGKNILLDSTDNNEKLAKHPKNLFPKSKTTLNFQKHTDLLNNIKTEKKFRGTTINFKNVQ